jgi:cytochrome-b5 reductase
MLETKKTKIGLLAGGSGITPMYAVALASSLAKDGVEITFLFSNKTKDDILCKKEMDELAAMNPKCKVVYTLTRHKEEHGAWDGEVGRIDAAMWQRIGMPPHADDVFIAMCGNKGFSETVAALTAELGYVKGVSCT